MAYPLFLSDFKWTLNFRDGFSKNTHISKFIKILHVCSMNFVEFYYICPTSAQCVNNYLSLIAISNRILLTYNVQLLKKYSKIY